MSDDLLVRLANTLKRAQTLTVVKGQYIDYGSYMIHWELNISPHWVPIGRSDLQICCRYVNCLLANSSAYTLAADLASHMKTSFTTATVSNESEVSKQTHRELFILHNKHRSDGPDRDGMPGTGLFWQLALMLAGGLNKKVANLAQLAT